MRCSVRVLERDRLADPGTAVRRLIPSRLERLAECGERAVAHERRAPGGVEFDTPCIARQVQPAGDVRIGDRVVADLHRVAASAKCGIADDRFVGHAVGGGSRGCADIDGVGRGLVVAADGGVTPRVVAETDVSAAGG